MGNKFSEATKMLSNLFLQVLMVESFPIRSLVFTFHSTESLELPSCISGFERVYHTQNSANALSSVLHNVLLYRISFEENPLLLKFSLKTTLPC